MYAPNCVSSEPRGASINLKLVFFLRYSIDVLSCLMIYDSTDRRFKGKGED
jgi:hypothetical protein